MHSCYKSIQSPRDLFQWLTALHNLYKQGTRLTQTQNDCCIYREIHMQVLCLFFLPRPPYPQYSALFKRIESSFRLLWPSARRAPRPFQWSPKGTVTSCVRLRNIVVALKYSGWGDANRSHLASFALVFSLLSPVPCSLHLPDSLLPSYVCYVARSLYPGYWVPLVKFIACFHLPWCVVT